jgi:hypothetical protein
VLDGLQRKLKAIEEKEDTVGSGSRSINVNSKDTLCVFYGFFVSLFGSKNHLLKKKQPQKPQKP